MRARSPLDSPRDHGQLNRALGLGLHDFAADQPALGIEEVVHRDHAAVHPAGTLLAVAERGETVRPLRDRERRAPARHQTPHGPPPPPPARPPPPPRRSLPTKPPPPRPAPAPAR